MNSNLEEVKTLSNNKAILTDQRGFEYSQDTTEKLDSALLENNAEIEQVEAEIKRIEQINLLINFDLQLKIMQYM
jgi:hypothetical protein